jgi:hypothetical protein
VVYLGVAGWGVARWYGSGANKVVDDRPHVQAVPIS